MRHQTACGDYGKIEAGRIHIFVVEHRFYYLRDLIDRVFLIQNGKIEQEFTREQFCSLPEGTRISYGLRTAYPERDAEHYQEKERRPMGKHLLSVQGLSFAYPKEQEVFRNVSFEAHAGDVIGILGHNGAGKTTLLSILTGLLKQRNGEITFDGRKLTPRQRRALSYLVMQDTDYQLLPAVWRKNSLLGFGSLQREGGRRAGGAGAVRIPGTAPGGPLRRAEAAGHHWRGHRQGQPSDLF